MDSKVLEFETAVVICSVYRPEKLVHAVQSVPPQYRVLVMCWSKREDVAAYGFDRPVEIIEMPGASICERTWAAAEILKDYNIIGICDDTKMFCDTIPRAERALADSGFGSRGVCGLKGITAPPVRMPPEWAFCLYGKQWIDTFDRRRWYCPAYQRFAVDHEWYLNAQAQGVWTYCPDAWIYHMPEDNDVTHNLGGRARIIEEDSQAFFQRKREGKLWGITEGGVVCES